MIGTKDEQASEAQGRPRSESEREREREGGAQATPEECCDDEKWETAAAEQRPPSDS